MSTESRDATVAERNKAAFRRIIEVGFSQGNLAALDAVVAADLVEHQKVTGLPPGLEGLKAMIRGLRAVLPDLTLTDRGHHRRRRQGLGAANRPGNSPGAVLRAPGHR